MADRLLIALGLWLMAGIAAVSLVITAIESLQARYRTWKERKNGRV